jgi:hypothetical protein
LCRKAKTVCAQARRRIRRRSGAYRRLRLGSSSEPDPPTFLLIKVIARPCSS